MVTRKLSTEAKEDYKGEKGQQNNLGLRNDVDTVVRSVPKEDQQGK
jgi:hypothetical protein